MVLLGHTAKGGKVLGKGGPLVGVFKIEEDVVEDRETVVHRDVGLADLLVKCSEGMFSLGGVYLSCRSCTLNVLAFYPRKLASLIAVLGREEALTFPYTQSFQHTVDEEGAVELAADSFGLLEEFAAGKRLHVIEYVLEFSIIKGRHGCFL